jgi:hypothetical protein
MFLNIHLRTSWKELPALKIYKQKLARWWARSNTPSSGINDGDNNIRQRSCF